MEKEPSVKMDDNLNDEFMGIVEKERKDVRREKFDLSSTRVILERLQREGLIKSGDTLEDIKRIVEEEYTRLEDL